MRLYITLSLLLFSIISFSQKNLIYKDSLSNRVKTASSSLEKAEFLTKLAFHIADKQHDSVQYYMDYALEFSKEHDYEYGVILNDCIRGINFMKKGNHVDAKTHLKRGLMKLKNIETKPIDYYSRLAEAQYFLGVVERFTSNLDEAVFYYEEALKTSKLAKKKTIKEYMVQSAIGQVYSQLNYYKKSNHHFKVSLEELRQRKDSARMANIYFFISYDYHQQKQNDLASVYIDSALVQWKYANNIRGEAAGEYTKGLIEMDRGNLDISLTFLKESLEKCKIIKDKSNELLNKVTIAWVEYQMFPNDQKKLKSIDRQYDAYLIEAEKLGGTNIVQDIYLHHNIVLNSLGNYKKAYDKQHSYLTMQDTIEGKQVQEQIASLQEKYYTAVSEQKITALNTENELAAIKLNNARRQSLILGGGLLLFSGLLFFLWNTFKKVKEQNEIITKNNDEKDILLREIHHRVKNNLQVISSLLLLQSKYVEDDSALNALQQGQNRVHSMALIHQNLYQTDNLTGVNAKEYFTKLVHNLFESYNITDDKISLKLAVDPLMLDVDTMIPLGLVMNELVSNSLKHAFSESRDGLITVTLKEEENSLILNVSDNGKGIVNIDEVEGKSFGFELIKAFAKKLNATLEVKGDSGFNTLIKIKNYTLAA